MSNDFDAFSGDAIDNGSDDFFFGEIVIYRGFNGIMTYDIDGVKGWQEYDSNLEAHKTAMATNKPNGKKRQVSTIYEWRHFPIGVGFETWENQTPIWSDDWTTFEQSLAELWGLDAKKQRSQLYAKLRELTNGGHYFRYKTPVIRTYTGNDGSEKSVRGVKVLEQFANADECQAAYETYKAGQPLPEGSKVEGLAVEALPKEQAIGFVATLAKQIPDTADCWQQLQGKFDEMPMLANLNIKDEDVQKAAMDASEVFKVPF